MRTFEMPVAIRWGDGRCHEALHPFGTTYAGALVPAFVTQPLLEGMQVNFRISSAKTRDISFKPWGAAVGEVSHPAPGT